MKTQVTSLDPDQLRKRAALGLREAMQIFDRWSLSNEQRATLLGTDPEVLARWQREIEEGNCLREPASQDLCQRLSCVVDIWKASNMLMPDSQMAVNFLRAPYWSASFSGKAPLDWMLRGSLEDLKFVCKWLYGCVLQ